MLSLMMVFPHFASPTLAASIQDPPPIVGVWSNACGSFVIASNNTSCGNLLAGNTISVQINITNAPVGRVDGYEFFLNYDPAFLTATQVDIKTGTVFSNPSLVKNELALQGQVHLAAVCLACSNTSTNGALASISFKILAVGVSPLSLAAGMVHSGFAQSFTELTTPSPLAPTTADGYFINTNGNPGPVASFTFPPKTQQGGTALFDATASFDPDSISQPNKGIAHYIWDFGGGSSLSGSVDSPTYRIILGFGVYGNFSVRLTVVDSDNSFEGMQTRLFTISQKPFHDVIAQSISATPTSAKPGDKVAVTVIIRNNGTIPENFNLNVSYSSPITSIGTQNNQTIDNGGSSSFPFTLDTTGLAPGFYTLTATVTVLRSLPYNPTGSQNITSDKVVRSQLQIVAASSPTSLLLVVGGVLSGIVALSGVGLLLRRRRQASASR
jgi:hypothetical protein